ncbi:hypothetical protein SIN09_07465 [Streptomyces sp. F8]|uniref:hypothetical protein n=1 Tax=Streptomyces sp. F8 TaxID=1436085 RepID=UPI0029D15D28|nr:hypothetical protein [Streptomyces sp. F8]MDX6759285.1 hypothetical protein [Streptomyces sp. F8]
MTVRGNRHITERGGIGDAAPVAAARHVIGRLADLRGHRPVLLLACAANAAALLALVAAPLLALAATAGLTVPQVGPLARAAGRGWPAGTNNSSGRPCPSTPPWARSASWSAPRWPASWP